MEHKVRCRGRIFLSEAGLVIGEAPNCFIHDTSMVRPSHATLRKPASQRAGPLRTGRVVQTPPGEAEGKDRFKRESGKALQVRLADASGGEQFQHTRREKPPGFSGLHGNGESRQHRPARERRERFAALHELIAHGVEHGRKIAHEENPAVAAKPVLKCKRHVGNEQPRIDVPVAQAPMTLPA